jgi:hypothetical protein
VKRFGTVIVLVAIAAAGGLGAWLLTGESAILQPVAFPHKAHLDLEDPKFECTTCHDQATKGPVAGRPSTKKCLSCHSGETKSAEEKKLQAFGEKGGEIPWRRVWRLPAHVFISHRTHVAVAKVKCQTCHGPMETLDRPPIRPLKELAMSDCIGCHEQWRWPEEGTPRVAEAAKAPPVRRVSTDCNACHR